MHSCQPSQKSGHENLNHYIITVVLFFRLALSGQGCHRYSFFHLWLVEGREREACWSVLRINYGTTADSILASQNVTPIDNVTPASGMSRPLCIPHSGNPVWHHFCFSRQRALKAGFPLLPPLHFEGPVRLVGLRG